jgi:uncharacterized paraquat-inducible protein A
MEDKLCICTRVYKITNKAEENQLEMTTAKLQNSTIALFSANVFSEAITKSTRKVSQREL